MKSLEIVKGNQTEASWFAVILIQLAVWLVAQLPTLNVDRQWIGVSTLKKRYTRRLLRAFESSISQLKAYHQTDRRLQV